MLNSNLKLSDWNYAKFKPKIYEMMFHGVTCCGIDYNLWNIVLYSIGCEGVIFWEELNFNWCTIKLEMDYNLRLNLDSNLRLSKRPPDCVVVENIELLHRTRAGCRVCNNNSFFFKLNEVSVSPGSSFAHNHTRPVRCCAINFAL